MPFIWQGALQGALWSQRPVSTLLPFILSGSVKASQQVSIIPLEEDENQPNYIPRRNLYP